MLPHESVRKNSGNVYKKQTADDPSGNNARKKYLTMLLLATSRPPLHPDLDVQLFTSQDGDAIGVPTLGGVDTMWWYTTEGVPILHPVRLRQLEAEREAAAAAAAAAATIVPGPSPVLPPQGPNPPPAPAVAAEAAAAAAAVAPVGIGGVDASLVAAPASPPPLARNIGASSPVVPPQDPPPPPVPAAAAAAAVAAATPAANGNINLATALQLVGQNAQAISGLLEQGKQALDHGKQAHKRCDDIDSRLDGHDAKLDEQDGRIKDLQAGHTQYGKEIKDIRERLHYLATTPRHAGPHHHQQSDHLFQLATVGSSAVGSPQASSKSGPNIVPPSAGAGIVAPKAATNMSPTTFEDKKPAARPSRSTSSDEEGFTLETTTTIVGNPPSSLTTFPTSSDPVLIGNLEVHDKIVAQTLQGRISASSNKKKGDIRDY